MIGLGDDIMKFDGTNLYVRQVIKMAIHTIDNPVVHEHYMKELYAYARKSRNKKLYEAIDKIEKLSAKSIAALHLLTMPEEVDIKKQFHSLTITEKEAILHKALEELQSIMPFRFKYHWAAIFSVINFELEWIMRYSDFVEIAKRIRPDNCPIDIQASTSNLKAAGIDISQHYNKWRNDDVTTQYGDRFLEIIIRLISEK